MIYETALFKAVRHQLPVGWKERLSDKVIRAMAIELGYLTRIHVGYKVTTKGREFWRSTFNPGSFE